MAFVVPSVKQAGFLLTHTEWNQTHVENIKQLRRAAEALETQYRIRYTNRYSDPVNVTNKQELTKAQLQRYLVDYMEDLHTRAQAINTARG